LRAGARAGRRRLGSALALPATCRLRHFYGRGRHFQPCRDEPLQRFVGAALLRQRPHAGFQDSLAAEILDTCDLVAREFRLEPHRHHHAVLHATKLELAQTADGANRGRIQPSRTTSRMKSRKRIKITGEMSMPPRLGRTRRIGLSAGSVRRYSMSATE